MAITKDTGVQTAKRRAYTFMDFLQDPSLLEQAGKEELAEAYFQISEFSKEVQGAQKEINVALFGKLSQNSDLIISPNGKRYTATKVKTTKFATKLEDAEKLGAVKTKTVVDTEVLKTLRANGVEVPGVVTTEYVLVKEVVEKEE